MTGQVLRISAIFFLVFAFSNTVMARDGYPEKLTVVYKEWYPYTYKQDNKAVGFEIDIFKAVMKRMGIEAVFEQFPFRRCLKMVEEGHAHVLISVLKTPERGRYTVFPGEHLSISRTSLFTRAGNQVRYGGSLKDLKGHTIGVITGFSYGAAFDRADYLNKQEVSNTRRLVNMVVGGRLDLGIENEAVIRGVAGDLGVAGSIRFLNPPVHSRKLYAGFSKRLGLQKLAAEFSRNLKEFKDTSEYRDILRRYGVSRPQLMRRKEESPGN
ncbi:MAG: Arginine-binding extracellular protein ArtP precursor [Syntrophorhabdus sp. PtaB.Bin184]|jgi:polar amino acid transport system substrate-binding protein|nr:MAG: Arginine-binding extracellular protein ArtP precursor [Syntrophorhabdus sp. PtaB.Bin184]